MSMFEGQKRGKEANRKGTDKFQPTRATDPREEVSKCLIMFEFMQKRVNRTRRVRLSQGGVLFLKYPAQRRIAPLCCPLRP
jgi:hypothetical protein